MIIVRAMLRQVLWICLILSVKVKARKVVTEEEKHSPWVNPHYDLCEEAECLAIEDIFTQTVDNNQMPCEDYFKYACYKNYTGSRDHEPFSKDPNQVLNDLMDILTVDVLGDLDTGNYALEIERQIFKNCKGQGAYTAAEKRHYERSVLPEFHANRLEPEFEYIRGQLSHWDAIDWRYGLKGFGFAFFDVDIYQPTDDPNERYILIKPPPNEIRKQSDLRAQRFKKRDHKLDKKYEHFMDKLAEILSSSTTQQSASEIRKITVDDWTKEYEEKMTHDSAKIDWFAYLSKLFGKVGATVRHDTLIAVQNPSYFKSLTRVLSHADDVDIIADYVHLHFVSKTIGLVDSNYRTYSILPQIDGLTCTPGLLAGTLYKYADKYFSAESQRVLDVLTVRVRDVVVKRLRHAISTAPDDLSTKLQSFAQQLNQANIYFGYPAWLMNATNAYRLYGTKRSIYSSTSFYENQARLIEQILDEKLKTWKQSNKPVIDLKDLTKGLESNRIEVNIEEGEEARILIPFGYFSKKNYKFFSSQLFDSINYGAAAAEIAFNMYYPVINSIFETSKEFKIPRCIEDQVSSHVRDRDTFAKKAVAYLLALETAYEALPFKHSKPIQFVDFGAMADTDLFFLSFAKSLCSITPKVSSSAYSEEKERKKSYRTDDYDILSYYIKFALDNSPAFAENYLCQDQLKRLNQTACDPLKFEH